MSSRISYAISEPRKSVHVCGFCLKNVGGRPPWGRRLWQLFFATVVAVMFSRAVLWELLDISWYSFYPYRFMLYNHQTSQAISASLTKLDWNVTIEYVGRECVCVCVFSHCQWNKNSSWVHCHNDGPLIQTERCNCRLHHGVSPDKSGHILIQTNMF